jgi:hypothetical protein
MSLEDLTIKEAKELANLFGSGQKPSPFEVGKKYLFRTVTHIDVGEVVFICGDFVTLKDSSWIADTGRFHDCLKNGAFNEVEPYPSGNILNLAALIDAAPWNHDLPREPK